MFEKLQQSRGVRLVGCQDRVGGLCRDTRGHRDENTLGALRGSGVDKQVTYTGKRGATGSHLGVTWGTWGF